MNKYSFDGSKQIVCVFCADTFFFLLLYKIKIKLNCRLSSLYDSDGQQYNQYQQKYNQPSLQIIGPKINHVNGNPYPGLRHRNL
jgi:hypothetical protein